MKRAGHSLFALAGTGAALGLLALLFAEPAACAEGARAGLALCGGQLVGALLPFFVASALLMASPLARWLGLALVPYTRFVLGLRAQKAAAALLLSWLGGFAVAARLAGQLEAEGALTARQAQRLLVAGVVSNPGFIVNGVGAMLGSPALGWRLLAAQLAANLAAGALFRFFLPENGAAPGPCPPGGGAEDAAPDLVGAVRGAVAGMLAVCGFVVFFSAVAQGLAALLPAKSPLAAPLAAALEVTSGCAALARLPGAAGVYGCCAALSVQSLSVLLQVKALAGPRLPVWPLVAARPVHLALSLAALRVLLALSPGAVAAAQGPARLIVQSRAEPDAALALFALCCAALWRPGFTTGPRAGIMRKKPEGRPRRVP